MKNLKRILSLALASVMVMGMMVVGASAATFVDQDAISDNHVAAVELVKALGIMKGKEGEKFDPKGNFTRAEMATIIATIHNKGVAPNFAKKVTPTYSDAPNSYWATSYIEYCTNFGLVGGVGGGKFDPEAPASATMVARMLLNLLGYTVPAGADWALTTEVQARQEDIALYDADLTEEITDPGKSILREQVAQMVANALDLPIVGGNTEAKTVYCVIAKDTTPGGLLTSLAGEKYDTWFEAYTVATTVSTSAALNTDFTITSRNNVEPETLSDKYLAVGKEYGRVSSVTKDTDGTYTVVLDSDANKTFTKITEDYTGLLNRNVKVLYKAANKVYNVKATDTVVATIDGGVYAAKVGAGKTYEEAASVTIYTNGGTGAAADKTKAGAIVTLVNENSDKKIEALHITLKKVATVSNAPKTTTSGDKTLVTVAGIPGLVNADASKVVGYEGLKKGDVVLYVTIKGITTIEKAAKVTGSVEGNHATKGLLMGGQYYLESALTGKTYTDGSLTNASKTYDLFLDNGGNIVAAAEASTSESGEEKESGYAVLTDVTLVTKSGDGSFGSENSVAIQARIVNADGTLSTVWVDSIDGVEIIEKDTPIKSLMGSNDTHYDILDGQAVSAIVAAGNATGVTVTAKPADDTTKAGDAKKVLRIWKAAGTTTASGDKVTATYYVVDTKDDLTAATLLFAQKGNIYTYTVNDPEKPDHVTLTTLNNVAAASALTAGKAEVGTGAAKFGNANTVFLYAATSGNKTTYTPYTGIANIPNATAVTGKVVAKDGVAAFVYVSAATLSGAASADLVYVIDTTDVTSVTKGGVTTYTMPVLLNGEKATIKTDTNPSGLTDGNLYAVTSIKDDVYTLNTTAKTAVTGIVGNEGGVLVVNSSSNAAYTYDAAATAFVIDEVDGETECSQYLVGDLALDANDKVYVEADSDDVIQTIYVFKVSNEPTVAIAAATTNSLTIDAANNKATGWTASSKENVKITVAAASGTTIKSVAMDGTALTAGAAIDDVAAAVGTHTVVVTVEDGISKAETVVVYTFTVEAAE